MYTEIVLDTELRWADALSDALIEAGALSASIEDADAGSEHERPLFGEPGGEPVPSGWQASRIVALFDADAKIELALAQAGLAAGLTSLPSWTSRPVAEADWVRQTQAQFEPIRISDRLWIVPSWHPCPDAVSAGAVVLKLDPGLAFGTGAHPTTRLCLEWLEQNLGRGQSLIDYGCGSGILGIAAKKLGAAHVTGTDIDPQAIRAAIENARDNQCDVTFIASQEMLDMRADIVMANILSNPLQVLAPLLAGLVAAHGFLVLSGVLSRQADAVIAAYRPWLKLTVWREDEGWVCLAGQHTRPGAP